MRTWTTTNLPEADQFGYWREVICEAFTSLSPATDSKRAFESSVTQRDIAGVLISDSKSKAQSIKRGAREISRNPTPRFFINLQVSGTCLMRQDAREVLARPGDFYLVDTTRPYQQDYSDWHVICVSIPRHLLEPLLISPARSTAVCLSCSDGGLGTIAGSFIQSLQNCSESISPAAKELLATSLVNVIAAALGGTSEAKEQGRASARHGLLEAIRAHAKRNATDPDLSVSTVAAKFRISPRYVHKLFEGTDCSFSQLVLEERLQRSAADLMTRGGNLSISEIAYRAGFGDLSHFCRAFRKRFGMSARDFRSEGIKQEPRG